MNDFKAVQSGSPNLSDKSKTVQSVLSNLSHASDDRPEFQQYLRQNFNLNFDVVAAYKQFRKIKKKHTHTCSNF